MVGRPSGSKNPGHEEERRRLAAKVLERLVQPDGPQASFRELARACAVTPPTLRHYFDDHEGVLTAALEEAAQQSRVHLDVVADAEMGGVRDALLALLRLTVEGWERYGVGAVVSAGLEVGLREEALGTTFLGTILEPLLKAYESRLEMHRRAGELSCELNLRYGALTLLSPVILALLHQYELGGEQCRPLDLSALIGEHVDAFLRAWTA